MNSYGSWAALPTAVAAPTSQPTVMPPGYGNCYICYIQASSKDQAWELGCISHTVQERENLWTVNSLFLYYLHARGWAMPLRLTADPCNADPSSEASDWALSETSSWPGWFFMSNLVWPFLCNGKHQKRTLVKSALLSTSLLNRKEWFKLYSTSIKMLQKSKSASSLLYTLII